MEFFLILLWILLCFAVGAFASRVKFRSGMFWGIFAAIFSPIIVFILVAILPSNAKECPQCKNRVHPEATVCQYCSYKFV